MYTTNDPTKKAGKFMLVVLLCAVLVGCADPAFSRYIEARRAAIAAMPPGEAKWRAEQQLAAQIYEEKRRQHAQTEAMVMAGVAGMAAGAAAANQQESSDTLGTTIETKEQNYKMQQIQNDLDTIRQEQINRDWNLNPQPSLPPLGPHW